MTRPLSEICWHQGWVHPSSCTFLVPHRLLIASLRPSAFLTRTVAAILQLDFKDKGSHTGRVISEAMRGGVMPDVKGWTVVSEPAENGLRTVLDLQAVGATRYFDAGGFYGRTLGLSQPAVPTPR